LLHSLEFLLNGRVSGLLHLSSHGCPTLRWCTFTPEFRSLNGFPHLLLMLLGSLMEHH
jgi:hypothetical protein